MYRIIVRWDYVVPIIVSALLVSACATHDSKLPSASASGSGTAQPIAAQVAAPDVTKAAAGSAHTATAVAPNVSLPAKPSTYLVQPGDTLALIARRPEIYGDSSMWMMLYRANAGQIPNMDWICPGQILAVPRAYTEADARAAQQVASLRAPWPTGAKAKAGYPCKVSASRAAARKPSALGPEGPAADGLAAAAGGGGAGVAEARNAPVPVPSTASPVTVGTSRNAYRDAARRAYNLRDIPWAIHYYRQHLEKVPRDADALGELGNVYYQTGNLPVAAGLFYDAARVLLDRGKRDAASRLLLAVSEGNPALAKDLYARLPAPARR